MTVLFAAKRAGGFGGSTKRPMEWPQPDSVEARVSSPRGCQEEQPWPSKRMDLMWKYGFCRINGTGVPEFGKLCCFVLFVAWGCWKLTMFYVWQSQVVFESVGTTPSFLSPNLSNAIPHICTLFLVEHFWTGSFNLLLLKLTYCNAYWKSARNERDTLHGTNISTPKMAYLKMIFLFPVWWDMLILWRVIIFHFLSKWILECEALQPHVLSVLLWINSPSRSRGWWLGMGVLSTEMLKMHFEFFFAVSVCIYDTFNGCDYHDM